MSSNILYEKFSVCIQRVDSRIEFAFLEASVPFTNLRVAFGAEGRQALMDMIPPIVPTRGVVDALTFRTHKNGHYLATTYHIPFAATTSAARFGLL
jgi:hypothetical protein